MSWEQNQQGNDGNERMKRMRGKGEAQVRNLGPLRMDGSMGGWWGKKMIKMQRWS